MCSSWWCRNSVSYLVTGNSASVLPVQCKTHKWHCCWIINIFGCFSKNVMVLLFIFAEKFIFNGQSVEDPTFCWDYIFGVFFGNGCMIFWVDWLHWLISHRSHIFLGSCQNTLPSIKSIFTGWMNEVSTHRPHSLRVFSNPVISVCR